MNKNNRMSVNTQIRSIYSDGYSSMMISFFNTNLSFRFYPFTSRDAVGKPFFDMKKGVTTTVNYDGAAALYIAATHIIDGKQGSNGMQLIVSCAQGSSLILERREGQNGQMETFFVILKNNESIPFKFRTHQQQVKENGHIVTKTIESGLGVFAMTIKGYLTGVGANRHLSKLPEDFDEIENMIQQPFNSTGNNSYQISYGSYQNTPSYVQT